MPIMMLRRSIYRPSYRDPVTGGLQALNGAGAMFAPDREARMLAQGTYASSLGTDLHKQLLHYGVL